MNENEFGIKMKLSTVAFLLATAGTLCFPQVLNLKENTIGFTNSIFAVFMWLLCLYAVNRSLQTIDLHNRRGWTIAGILSGLFTAAMLFGVRLDAVGNVGFTAGSDMSVHRSGEKVLGFSGRHGGAEEQACEAYQDA